MQKMRELGKYPIAAGFFALLLLFMGVDLAMPDRQVSVYENKELAQAPAFTLAAFAENEWTSRYDEYIRDQFVGRDGWVAARAALETAQGKLETGGVWLAGDGYQIAKNDGWSIEQQTYFSVNTRLVGDLAARYPGRVYTMIVPSPANILSFRLRGSPHQIDENGRTDEMNAQLAAAGAGVIDLREAFLAQALAGGQVYYRTDHHWTTDGGALLAYQAFCAATGRSAAPPPAALRTEVPGFYGTNYAKTRAIGTAADTLVYYDLPNALRYFTLNADGSTGETRTGLMNKTKLDEYDKYAAFLHGNQGYSVIEGNGEGRLLVLKDSYANSFVPYLLPHYAEVHVLDARMWVNSIYGIVDEGGFDEVLVLYSFSSFSEDSYLNRIFR